MGTKRFRLADGNTHNTIIHWTRELFYTPDFTFLSQTKKISFAPDNNSLELPQSLKEAKND